jgi:hypothetical protein
MTECTLLREEAQALFQQNDEKKTRTSAKSTLVGTARVMSYEDIVINQSRKTPATRPRARGELRLRTKGLYLLHSRTTPPTHRYRNLGDLKHLKACLRSINFVVSFR